MWDKDSTALTAALLQDPPGARSSAAGTAINRAQALHRVRSAALSGGKGQEEMGSGEEQEVVGAALRPRKEFVTFAELQCGRSVLLI